MKILIPTLGFGRSGGNRVLSELASRWQALGHDVTFLAHAGGAEPYFPTTARCIWLNDRGDTVAHASLPSGRLGGVAGVARMVNALRRGIARHEADVVLANHMLTAWATAAARTSARRWYYVQAYETELYEGGSVSQRVLRLLAAMSYLLPLRRIVNAPMYRRYKLLRAEHVVPPGLALDRFHAKTVGFPSAGDVVTLGTIGRHEPWKGTADVIAAYRQLRESGVSCRLVVAYGNVDEVTAALPGVTVTVPRDDDELAAFYRSIDILLVAARLQLQAVHYPVIEAMASGTTVVTTGYYPADDSNAYLARTHDPASIADAVIAALANPELRNARAARARRAVQSFDWNIVAESMLDAFTGRG